MTLTCSLTSAAADRVEADLLAVPVYADRELGPGADAVDAALGGGLDAFMVEADFSGKAGESLPVPTDGRLGANAAVLVGLGPRAEVTAAGIRRAAALVARRARKVRTVATTLLEAGPRSLEHPVAAQALAEGLALGGYRFLTYKSDGESSKLGEVRVVGRGGAAVRRALDRGLTVARAVSWARDVVNEPSGAKSPVQLAAAAARVLRGKGVTVRVLDVKQMQADGLGGVLGVGQGSQQPPRFVKMTYAPRGSRATVALVGKGVVFDSGGLSLKTASGMETMKTDMAGGAAVIATMSALRDLGVRVKVVGYVPMVENMPSGAAIRPGDVLHIRNGKTVEVLNTDAEGRLILADALSLACEDEPDAVVDLATLTGACVVALGEKVAGLMGRGDGWLDQVRAAADRAGEAVWPLPLPAEYRSQLDSEVADVKNIGNGGYGGALTAGLFLSHFVEDDLPWAHLDIAGPARAAADDGEVVRGGTGFGVRTLAELLTHFRKPARA